MKMSPYKRNNTEQAVCHVTGNIPSLVCSSPQTLKTVVCKILCLA